jgi:hypothetical protein
MVNVIFLILRAAHYGSILRNTLDFFTNIIVGSVRVFKLASVGGSARLLLVLSFNGL